VSIALYADEKAVDVAVSVDSSSITGAADTTSASDNLLLRTYQEAQQKEKTRKKSFFSRVGSFFTGIMEAFDNFDTIYIEPQKYNYAFMVQNTNTYEVYQLSSKDGQSITFAPDLSYRVGPYFGWRWIFLGYTIDLTHISSSSHATNRQEYVFSLYSSLFGVDLFWKETGNNYKVRSMDLGDGIDTENIEGADFGGVKSSIRGFNTYYIFNHKKFSYPAAYSQSTVQRKSAGSFLAGIGYSHQRLEVDWNKLDNLVEEKLGDDAVAMMDSTLTLGVVNYVDVNISGGYAYNWVFSRNWLFDISLQVALAYKHSKQDLSGDNFRFQDFSVKNFNVDGVGRFGIVYNNMKWYAGMSAILHTYNYSKSHFSTNNMFGSVNFYVGFNFGRKKQYR